MQDTIFVLLISMVLAASSGARAAESAEAPAGDAETPSATIDAPVPDRGNIIKSIEFEGNRKFKDHVLRQRLGFELGDPLDAFLAEGGRLTIEEVYRKIGFAFVNVSLDRDQMSRGDLLYRIDEGTRIQIESVSFVGNEVMDSGTLEKVVKTTERKWLLWPFYYTEDAVEEDLDRLREFYYDHGHLDYRITANTEFTEDRTGVRVTFVIEEGPVYRVADIVLSGNTHFTSDELRTTMTLREGQVYLKPTAVRDAREIARLYREIGYIDAEVRQIGRASCRERV
jgi:outer membrane protein insertion porin family